MSTFLKSDHQKQIKSADALRQYFHRFAKPAAERLVGIECELLAVDDQTGEALSYSGSRGVETVLNELAYEFGYEKIIENGHTIGLKKGSNLISLEPGGQIELSAEPVKSVHQVRAQLDAFFFELKTVAQFIGHIEFLAYGIQPFSSNQKIEWVPKLRYGIMSKYLGKHGRLAHDMMKRTASNQVSFDYSSEHDAFEKMCIAMRLSSIATAMFANSSFSKGKPSGFVTERLHIWRYTDPARSGLLENLLCPQASFDAYLNYLLDLPMMFIVRKDKWITIPNLTFRKFIEKGFRGEHATEEDFALHLSTVFPEARFKQYLEIRGADGQRTHMIPAVAAFWKGILYDDEVRLEACALLKKWTEKDYIKLHQDVETLGLKAKVKGKPILDIAKQLVKLSEKGLEKHPSFNAAEQDERIFLEPLKHEVLKTGKTQADQLVSLWNGPFRKSRKALIQYLKI